MGVPARRVLVIGLSPHGTARRAMLSTSFQQTCPVVGDYTV